MSKKQLHHSILHHIFESSSQAILVLDDDKLIIKANLAAQQLFGYEEFELENSAVHTIIPEYVQKITSDTKQSISDIWIVKKDGSQSLVNMQLKSVRNSEGFDAILFIQDATDSLVYQWALKKSQEDLSIIQSEGNLGNWYWIFETDERYWSDEFYRICGLPPGDARLNAKTALSFIHPDDRERAKALVAQTIEKHIPYTIEKRIVQPNGAVRNVLVRGKIDYNAKGDPVRMSGTMKDITQLKHGQEALFESNRKYKTLINNLNGIVYSCQNDPEYTMGFINEGCFAITGYTRDEFMNGTVHYGNIILDEDRIYVWHETQKALSEKTHFNIRYRIECKKGTIKYVREIGCGVYHDSQLTREGFIADETEQKETQEILEIMNRALEAAGSGILISDALKPNLPIIYCNQSFTKITGYEKAEVLGKNCQFLQNNDKDQPQIKTMRIAIREEKPCRVKLRNYRKDGTQFWNDLTITPVKNSAGKTTHFIGVQNDITKQKKAEILKDDTNEILELITEDAALSVIGNKIIETIETHIPESVASISLRNSKTNAMERLSESEKIRPWTKKLIETKDSDLTQLHPAFGSIKKIIVTRVNDHNIWRDYKDFIEAIGVRSCWSFPILSSQKNLLGLLTVYNTDDKKIDKKIKGTLKSLVKLLKVTIEKYYDDILLKEKEKQLESYTQNLEEKVKERTKEVEATIEKLVSTNLDLEDQIEVTQAAEKSALASKSLSSAIAKNFPNGFIVVINSNFEIVLKEGEAIDELGLDKVINEGMSIDDIVFFSEDQKNTLKEDVIKTMNGEHLSYELAIKNRYFSVHTTPLVDENDEIFSALFVYNNISKHKKIERDSQNALKKEQELNELKSRFISMASHEFRTPLSAIQTSAILIGKPSEPAKEEKKEKYVRQILNNVKHLVVILNDFLSLSKLEEGKVIANSVIFDLVSFSKKLVEEISVSTKAGQNILFSSSRKELLLKLDPKLMRHVLMNLLTNAIKYSPENTTIHFDIVEDDQFVVLSIRDQGIGIPKEEQKHLFERFFRAKNAQNIEGTGLGLSIVKQYVELMGGSIHFTSEPNNATTFSIKWLKPNKE